MDRDSRTRAAVEQHWQGDLWVSQCIISYDGKPSYSVSIMEFADEHVAHETQYFAEPFEAPAWRTDLAEPM